MLACTACSLTRTHPPTQTPAQPNGYIFTSVINACEKGGAWQRALEVFKAMQSADIGSDSMTMVARRALYAFPALLAVTPAPLLAAARTAVDSGRAARRWLDRKERQLLEEL